LFDPFLISPQHPYNPYNQPGVPLELSPCTSLDVRRHLFPDMEPKGDAPVTSSEESKVSTPHTFEEEEHPFPPKGFPYTGGIPSSVPPNYVSLS